ncbi:MAG: hypothetical protein Q8P48_02010, partial [Deltaproteobacteria bacterium]|nr:hypothetical protein [Deltaproteobacteria bacterium]
MSERFSKSTAARVRERMAEFLRKGDVQGFRDAASQMEEEAREMLDLAAEYGQTAARLERIVAPQGRAKEKVRRKGKKSIIGKTSMKAVRARSKAGSSTAMIERLLREAGTPMTLREVYEAMGAAGRTPTGKNPLNSVYTYLSRLGKRGVIRRKGENPVRYELVPRK